MIEIKITSLETCDKPMLSALAEMFAKLANTSLTTIAADDNPAAGSPTVSDAAQTFASVEAVNPATAFAPTVTTDDAAKAFGIPPAPNAPLASVAASAPATVSNTNLAPLPPADVSPVMLDADNLPWDARIHSSARSQNADGRWKKKRGVDNMIVQTIESELRGVMALPTSAPLPPSTALIPGAPGFTHSTAPAPAAPAATAPFPALLMKITSSGISLAQVTAILQPMGIASLPVLAARPDLIPQVEAQIDALIAS